VNHTKFLRAHKGFSLIAYLSPTHSPSVTGFRQAKPLVLRIMQTSVSPVQNVRHAEQAWRRRDLRVVADSERNLAAGGHWKTRTILGAP
jgi:hypothetical protein